MGDDWLQIEAAIFDEGEGAFAGLTIVPPITDDVQMATPVPPTVGEIIAQYAKEGDGLFAVIHQKFNGRRGTSTIDGDIYGALLGGNKTGIRRFYGGICTDTQGEFASFGYRINGDDASCPPGTC